MHTTAEECLQSSEARRSKAWPRSAFRKGAKTLLIFVEKRNPLDRKI